MKRLAAVLVLLAFVTVAAAAAPAPAAAEEPVVRAVLFFSPTCGHCAHVINDLLLPVWFPQYGGEPDWYSAGLEGEEPSFYLVTNGTLEVLLIDAGTSAGGEFYYASAEELGIPQERMGVPRLVVGDRYLIGSLEIPEQFPGIIEEGLASGGIDWPDLTGVEEILAAVAGGSTSTTGASTTTTEAAGTSTTGASTTTTEAAGTSTTGASTTTTEAAGTSTTGASTTTTEADGTSTTVPDTTTTTDGSILPDGDSPWDRFRRDPVANSVSVVVLALMVFSLAGVALLARREDDPGPPGIAVPLLALAGLAVAIYLGFVETSGIAAVCGPVGDCNTVQQSEWARVFGVFPVGLIGVAGYVVVLMAWAVARFVSGSLADWARVALFAGTVAGTGFSIYLTFLEPFVIGATCLWCLFSAVTVTLLMWLAARPAAAAWERLGPTD